MEIDTDPLKWNRDGKALIQLSALIITIIGSVTGSAIYLGHEIYGFAAGQLLLTEQLRTLRLDFQTANGDRMKALDKLEQTVVPRIGKLEDDVRATTIEAAAARQRTDDMREDLIQLKDLATRNLSVTESHDADIRATRNAVAPRNGVAPKP